MMAITSVIPVVLYSFVGALTSTGCCSVKRLPLVQQQQSNQRTRRRRRQSGDNLKTPLAFSLESLESTGPVQPWLDKGLLLSSYTDGLKSNRDAQDWLCEALVERLWYDVQRHAEEALQKSTTFSPCNGPDPVKWQQLDDIDQQVLDLYPNTKYIEKTKTSSWKRSLEQLLIQQHSKVVERLEVRLLYIPTASYALRNDSINTPGKQRQRARADGKKRRNELVAMLQQNFDGVAISVVTLDLDDGSVKQAECTIPYVSVDLPTSGKQAIQSWQPHLIYVQGGNTFWLYHCMEKGDWGEDLIEACCSKSEQPTKPTAVYCGVSAGAILVGRSMQTACWKEWDDPSVVPGREMYHDWKDVRGLSLVGSVSFFPHMEDRWQTLVEERVKELPRPQEGYECNEMQILSCLKEEQVCFVDGRKGMVTSTGVLSTRLSAAATR